MRISKPTFALWVAATSFLIGLAAWNTFIIYKLSDALAYLLGGFPTI